MSSGNGGSSEELPATHPFPATCWICSGSLFQEIKECITIKSDKYYPTTATHYLPLPQFSIEEMKKWKFFSRTKSDLRSQIRGDRGGGCGGVVVGNAYDYFFFYLPRQ